MKSVPANHTPDEVTLLHCIVALLVDERERGLGAKGESRKTELVLSDAGMTTSQIASVLAKPFEAVKTTLRRAKKA